MVMAAAIVATMAIGQTSRPASQAELLEAMRALPKLSVRHHCWPLDSARLQPGDPLVSEYARIAGSVGVSASCTDRWTFDAACIAAKQTGAVVSLHYSPWHQLVTRGISVADLGLLRKYEFVEMRERLSERAAWLKDFNARYGCDVRIEIVCLDTEAWSWSEPGLAGLLAETCSVARACVPGAKVAFFGSGWWPKDFVAAVGDDGPMNVPLYDMPRVTTDQEYELTRMLAKGGPCAVWLAIGCGYPPDSRDARCPFTYGLDYDTKASWEMGRRLAAVDTLKWVCLWPQPFCPLVTRWGDHFVAYCRGFSGLPMLEAAPTTRTASSMAAKADLDGDGDVDLADFRIFENCMNGANRPPKCR